MTPPAREAPDLRGSTLPELERFVAGLGEPAYRARQIYRWLHHRYAERFEEMSDLPKALRARLETCASVTPLSLDEVQASRDGTVKFRFLTRDGHAIESVYLPEWRDRDDDEVAPGRPPDRQTLCISTQVGCAMGCAFCMTATMGLVRNLAAGEIVDQVYRVNRWLIETRGLPGPRPVTNLVYMGMGEPLHNYAEVKRSLELLQSEAGANFSHRHITVSTSGLVPAMERLGRETEVKLAVSLTGTTDEVRSRLMPVNRRWSLAELLDACRRFPMRRGRRITFEYVLLDGVTDAMEDADRLARLLRGIPAKVNLIAYNESPLLGFHRPPEAVVEAFRARLARRGLTAVVRRSRGRDIAAACGQLATAGAGGAAAAGQPGVAGPAGG